jgi:hypothetical protein
MFVIGVKARRVAGYTCRRLSARIQHGISFCLHHTSVLRSRLPCAPSRVFSATAGGAQIEAAPLATVPPVQDNRDRKNRDRAGHSRKGSRTKASTDPSAQPGRESHRTARWRSPHVRLIPKGPCMPPSSRTENSNTANALSKVNTSAAASWPRYFLVTGAAIWVVAASRYAL